MKLGLLFRENGSESRNDSVGALLVFRSLFSPLFFTFTRGLSIVTQNRVKEWSYRFEGHLNIDQHLKIYKYANFQLNHTDGFFKCFWCDVL
jgi:hypothetical protein